MVTKLFVNIPCNDLERSKSFYTSIGWQINPQFTDENAASVVIDDNAYLMVLQRDYYASFLEGTGKSVGDPANTSLALISFDLPSRQAVDELTQRVQEAGGVVSDPKDYGFMYQRAFEDPDGNRFEPFWMDADAVGSF
jgi:predicted lactoylglutathione lyase